MTDWFRSWHGAPTDPKWLAVARKAGVAPSLVVAVAWALMDRASQAADRGSIAGFDADALAAFMACDEADILRIVSEFEAKGVIVGSRLRAWESRQPKREDNTAAERKQAWKERQEASRNGPERTGTHWNAPERTREEESRVEDPLPSSEDQSSLRSDSAQGAPVRPPDRKISSEESAKRRMLALGVPGDLLADFLRVRKAHKAPLTDNAALGLIREFEAAGLTETEGIRLCVERNWRGFRRDFLIPLPGGPHARN